MAFEFEKPILELEEKIGELEKYAVKNKLDLTKEISFLEKKVTDKKDEIYNNLTPWQRVEIARYIKRPTTLEYIDAVFDDFIEFFGDRVYSDDAAVVGGIATYKGSPVTIIGHQRGRDTKDNIKRNFGMAHPDGYRKALRLMKQADKFNRPVICLIDTKGAYPGRAAEERGQSESIARNLVEMAGLKVPVISIVIGEGGSGGALALGVCNRLLMLENATYSVISPEGAASILFKDASLKEIAAESLKITANDLKSLGIADEVIREPQGGAHNDRDAVYRSLDETLEKHLDELSTLDRDALMENRYQKYMDIGIYEEQS
ncbi:acetyl-CoA carboxylase carboxyltransferase subunit alpha [Salinicoccus halodurans]|uniref:Acetyl-coenzyme A carboxylase carboxyl transferase subunit alpha n=1 Tax=Salinicoccus halodurans TaxID=407035 RepID=A0A0F7HLP4_9STAP|nr:acetyl-CoA carboxylase carboxyltransferase subunit alpha [Salinicoccus halodurans]AKG74243.1 acetyl-CoA carboxylase subunit alpha [Salinicoccus halodurans]SFK93470.1 acetyl-CoA carboxylase carboxyltransferase subunit alpha [Salinicoccus halodurans]